jgi:hypothetical protein
VIDELEMLKFQKAFSMPTSIIKGNNFGEETKLLDLKIHNISEDCKSCSSGTSVSQPDISPKKQEMYSNINAKSEVKSTLKSTKKINKKYFLVQKAKSIIRSKKYRSNSPSKGVINNKIKGSSRKLTVMKTNSSAFKRNYELKKSAQNSQNSCEKSMSSDDKYEESSPRQKYGNRQGGSIISPIRCIIDCLKGTLL